MHSQIDWGKTTSWKLYDLNGRKGFSIQVDSLSNFRSTKLNDDSVHNFLRSISQWPKEKTAVWMGYFVATCKTPDNNIHKIDISMYGGFFFDETTHLYYELPEQVRDEWMKYINVKYETIENDSN